MMQESLLQRLDRRDRALFARWSIGSDVGRSLRGGWTLLTHVGGAMATIAFAVLPLAVDGALRSAALHALATLILSHVAVQMLKRSIGRPRPSRSIARRALVHEPDRFSFPSGHAAAAMSVAVAYSMAFPSLAGPLCLVAGAVGLSRVCLGVHYPGDVFVAQLIAVATAIVLA